MNKYTVILLRPDRLTEAGDNADLEFGQDTYVCYTEADELKEAVEKARQEVLAADEREWGKKAMRKFEVSPRDYTFVMLFDGHQKPALSAWEVPGL